MFPVRCARPSSTALLNPALLCSLLLADTPEAPKCI